MPIPTSIERALGCYRAFGANMAIEITWTPL